MQQESLNGIYFLRAPGEIFRKGREMSKAYAENLSSPKRRASFILLNAQHFISVSVNWNIGRSGERRCRALRAKCANR